MPSTAGTSGSKSSRQESQSEPEAGNRSRIHRILWSGFALLLGGVLITCAQPRGKRWDDLDSGNINEGGIIGENLVCGGDPLDDRACDYRADEQVLLECAVEFEFYRIDERSCTAEGLVCVDQAPFESCENREPIPNTTVIGCALCYPCAQECVRNNVARCLPDGSGWEIIEYCDTGRGEICDGGRCGNGCELAERYASNVGCEYYTVDLDNAVVSSGSAAAQQFSVVVSNPSPVEAYISVERCLAHPCADEANRERVDFGGLDELIINPMDLETLHLDPLEVDGSVGEIFNSGTHSWFGPAAYRIVSTAPIIVYQFNPYDNSVQVFSNDASLLIPVTALGTHYTVLSWPQTIAYTPESTETNMNIDLRAFLTIVGTAPNTHVTIRLSTDIVPSGDDGVPIPRRRAGETLELTLGPFDVANLETGYYNNTSSFNADFTGTIVDASAPVAVFTGSEAADVPAFKSLDYRFCCGDHLEQQLAPDHTLGFSFVVPHTPPRTQAVARAGASVTPLEHEPEWFRILATHDDTFIETSLEEHPELVLDAGEHVTLESDRSFTLRASSSVAVGQFVGSQWTTGMTASDLPGGDPAFILIPPIEQWRRSYVFLTPDKYAFDYVMVTASSSQASHVTFDGEPMATRPGCWRERADGLPQEDPSTPDYYVITCALSDPKIIEGLPRPENIVEGHQEDGVHEVRVEGGEGVQGIGLVVYGFDSYVSYGYPGGTDLRQLQ